MGLATGVLDLSPWGTRRFRRHGGGRVPARRLERTEPPQPDLSDMRKGYTDEQGDDRLDRISVAVEDGGDDGEWSHVGQSHCQRDQQASVIEGEHY
jgi:hypothetical protein